ncbi:MAG: ATPase domain-containing protein, partial [Megasphaera elsdenii]
MAKKKTRYVCTNCGSVSSRWLGRCPQCGEWNTMTEETVEPEAPKAAQSMARSGPASQAASLADIAMEDMARMETGIGELDRVLGGGIVPGALILLSGDPGIGKSTLVL